MSNSSSTISANSSFINIEIWAIPYFVGGFFAILLNLLTLLTFAVNTHLRKRSVYLVLSVTVADLEVGIAMVTIAVTLNLEKIIRNGRYHLLQDLRLMDSLEKLGTTSSFLGLILISLERMFVALFPLRHRILGNRVYQVTIAFQWISSIVLMAVHMKFSTYETFDFLALTGLTIICFAYICIYAQVRRQHLMHKQRASNTAQKRERELAKTLFIVTVLSLVTWLPDGVELSAQFSVDYTDATNIVRCANSLVNPVVYLVRIREFRHALYKLVLKCSRDKPVFIPRVVDSDIYASRSNEIATKL